jgi:hypothetical protein
MFWRKPPPQPIYKRRPIATAAVILTMVGMFVLGPVGAIYDSMSEELKKKADYDTVILILKQQKEKDDRQWEEIKNNRQQATISAPKSVQITGPAAIMNRKVEVKKRVLTPEQFEKYITMSPEIQAKYKRYLKSRGFDTEGL